MSGSGAFDYLADGVTVAGPFYVADISFTAPAPLPTGYRVLLICEDAKGYAQTFPARVP